MGKKLVILFIIVLLIVLGISAKVKNATSKQISEEKDLGLPVEIVEVKEGQLTASMEYSGTLKAMDEVVISPKIAAKIETLTVKEGDFVKKGQVLYTLDQRDLKTKLDTLQQKVVTAELNVKHWEKQNLDSLKQKINSAEINAEHWKKQYDSYQNLYKEGAISEEAFEKVGLTMETAMSSYQEAQLLLKDKSNNDNWMRESSQSGLREVRLLYEEAKVNLDNTIISSPINGVVTSVQNRVGEMTAPGKPMINLALTDDLKVQTKVFERDLKNISQETEVVASFPNLNIEPLTTNIDRIYPSLDPNIRATIVEVQLPKSAYSQEVLKPGMSVNLAFLLAKKDKVSLVPKEAILIKKGKHYLYVDQGNIANLREVRIGIENRQQVEIIDGVKVGERVILADLNKIFDGKRIYPLGREDNI